MITNYEIEKLGKLAAEKYVSESVDLNETIKKFGEERNLTPEQTKRILESANIETYLSLFPKAENHYVEFPVADFKKITPEEQPTEKEVFSEDYSKSPVEKFAEETGIHTIFGLEKVAEEVSPNIDFKKLAQRGKEFIEFLESKKIESDLEFTKCAQDFESDLRQMILRGDINVLELEKTASVIENPEFNQAVINSMDLPLKKRDERVEGFLNEDHSIVKKFKKLAEMTDRHTLLLDLLSDAKTDLKFIKKAAVSGVLEHSAKTVGHVAETGMAAVYQTLKHALKHPQLWLALLGGTALYQLGKQKGGSKVQPKMKELKHYQRPYYYETKGT